LIFVLRLKLTVHPYFLKFIHPFALAHGTRKGTDLAFVKLEHEGITAYGEASLPPYLSETVDSVRRWVLSQEESILDLLASNPFEYKNKVRYSKENTAASAALQSAIINWHLAAHQENLTDYFAQTVSQPDLTLTITKNDSDFLPEKFGLESDFTHYKLKLTGSDDDLDFVKLVRSKTKIPFCIDINQGYGNKEEAIQLISELEKLNCVLVEQPLNADDHEGHHWLKLRTELPIIADESIKGYEDLVNYSEAYSGVNIKLMKCGGLFQAQQMINYVNTIHTEDRKYLKLIGCMSESSLGVSMAAVLASQCDMADLDAPYLNCNDPFGGFQIFEKKIIIGEIASKDSVSF
jgi:L-alanine-DL-glutamate epimerase-like enolase superfamily enzyme